MAKKKRKKSGRRKKCYSDIFIEFFMLIILIPFFFGLSLLIGIGYLFAFAGSLYHKTIFRKKHVARFIIIGSILTYIAGAVLLYGFSQGDTVPFFLIMALGILVWYSGFRMKRKVRKGK